MRMMLTRTIAVTWILFCCVSSVVGEGGLERIRRFHEHDEIETATVHITYPQSPAMRRLTKREVVNNLLPSLHSNFNVKVTLNDSGHVLDLQLEPSKLEIHGALVQVMNKGAVEEAYHFEDEKCHYQGFFDNKRGMASVHFCDGFLVGSAHNGDKEFSFHPLEHPFLNHAPPSGLVDKEDEEHYHTIVSWKDASRDRQPFFPLWTTEEEEEERSQRQKRQVEEDTEDYDDRVVDGEDVDGDLPDGGDDEVDVSGDAFKPLSVTPVAEFGLIMDEDWLTNAKLIYPSNQAVLNLIQFKFTALQALYGNPALTGFNMTLQIKLVYFWRTNPSWYGGSKVAGLGKRIKAGANFIKLDSNYAKADAGAMFTQNNAEGANGMAVIGGACKNGKTFISTSARLKWILEAHEFGHTLGLNHNSPLCRDTSQFGRGFMGGGDNVFMRCYAKTILPRLRYSMNLFLNNSKKGGGKKCFFTHDLDTTNIPPMDITAHTFPVLALGLNQYCHTFLNDKAVMAVRSPNGICQNPDGRKRNWPPVCAVLDANSAMYGLALVSDGRGLDGSPCMPGKICICGECVAPPTNLTTMKIIHIVTGTWGDWSSYDDQCSSACGVGVQISSRQCSNQDRAEACWGLALRAKLCNMGPCPGDELMDELQLRYDRANYSCSLFKAQNSPPSRYTLPHVRKVYSSLERFNLTEKSCLVKCAVLPWHKTELRYALNRKDFGTVLLADGTFCGLVKLFDRHVLGVTKRCVRGNCVEFGCDDISMETSAEGKVKDMCGVCGGDNSTCTTGNTTVSMDATVLVHEIPAGTRGIMFGVYLGGKMMQLVLADKDDEDIVVSGGPKVLQKENTDDNPLNFAGTRWTAVKNYVFFAAGPIDQPLKIKVKNKGLLSDVSAAVAWGYKLPNPVPPPPLCHNGGIADAATGGCQCVGDYRGRQCMSSCMKLCFNGGVAEKQNCKCDCKGNPRTDHSRRCRCLPGFGGLDCSQCVIKRCHNGGILDTTSCQCQCPVDRPKCRCKPDCSACNYNAQLPSYRGHYGGGSLESYLRARKGTPKNVDGEGCPANGQTSVHGWSVKSAVSGTLFSVLSAVFGSLLF